MEDSRHGLSPLSGGREPVYSSVREEGRGGRAYIQVAAKGGGGLQRVQRAIGGRIPVDSYDDSTREGGVYMVAIDHTGRRDWTPDLQDVLPGKGRKS